MAFAANDDNAVRNRFESFKLGKGLPAAVASKHGHARSHSRNLSLSVNDFSFPSLSPTFSPSPSPTATTHPANPQPPSKRNSHHRRRSSVSTRHESAEMMGVALPDLPPATSDDNINLGEKDSIRRRALWALEGKPDVSFSKVEIPDISTPDIEKMLFDFSTKPSAFGNSLTASSSKRDSFKLLGSSSSSKDQLGTLLEEEEEEEEPLPSPASSIKENMPPPPNTPISPNTPMTPALSITKATPAKLRPSNLNLRPLSLTPDNLPGIVASLPSPSLTPSPRPGLRSLSLTPSNSGSGDDHASTVSSLKQSRRSSLVISPTPNSRRPILNLALDQLDHTASIVSDEDQKPSRRSSISYKRSHTSVNSAGLPTPEMTPTFSRRTSSSLSSSASNENDDEVFANPPTPQTRPLSASEQHFLFKSHNALLARITDLERALSMRRRESGGYSNGGSSRPTSVASNFSSSSSGGHSSEPSDEMLNLIADLKSERDELKRDVDGWRTRVGDMESQMTVLTKRVENERREAWVARSRVGLLEVEKELLTKKMAALDEMFAAHEKERCGWVCEMDVLRKENEDSKKRVMELEEELCVVRQELADERMKKDPMTTPTPRSFDAFTMGLSLTKKHGLGFASVDSESSSTDVEHDSSDDNHHPTAFGFSLKSVQEESDEADYSEEDSALAGYEDEDDEDNGLIGYEDEEDTDMSLQSSSSFGSEEDISPRSFSHLQDVPVSPTTPKPHQVFTPPRSNHARRATLSKTWTFPFGGQPLQTPPKADEEDSDRFFGCLEDGENDTMGSVPSSPSAYSYEKSKGLFSSGFKFAAEDDNASFFLPDGVGILADEDEKDEKRLSVVTEEVEEEDEESEREVEDDEDMFGEIGGIRITFTPPQEEPEVVEERKQIQVSPIKRTSPPPILPALNFGGYEEDGEEEEDNMRRAIPFNFGRPLMHERKPSPPPVPVVVTPVSVHSRPSSPSMIPRPASPSRPVSPVLPAVAVSPPPVLPVRTVPAVTSPSPSSNSFTTPPNKRGGALPSFIPQPVSSPSPMRSVPTSTKPRVIPTSTFIRQPSRKPLLPPSTAAAAPSSTTTTTSAKVQSQSGTGNSNVPSAMNTRSFRRSSDEQRTPAVLPPAVFFDGRRNQHHTSAAQMKSIDLSHDSVFSATATTATTTSSSPPPPPSYSSSTRYSTSTFSRNAKSSISSNASSSISSIVSSPLSARLSFQSITNFMPMSWAPRPTPTADVPSISVSQHTPADALDDDPTIVAPVPRPQNTGGYVSRERQLRKLRNRMEVEGVLAMKMQVQIECKKCDGGMVYI